ncbi:DNA translocase FtsK [Mammaliicoccus stepanovicii]|uniref:Cell division protein FtsK n=1 Tax=Mammaliicoccus stepanovicii TaxID=643214 RepID=A0A239YYA7_9STAP|nr:DNA translocase FtsK [Mammaliicoccus stepanovicii]GGI40437.1 DNA translocase FtsK [Mammaliicoccus stepanovicii]SNV64141.1 cell division protein FtsK [Mammaliicoccus stepanovicii]
MKTKGSEPMSWFDDIFGQSKNKNNNEKQNNEKVSFNNDPDDESINEEVYKRPKGKFRFPIQMENDHEEQSTSDERQSQDNQQEEYYRDDRFYEDKASSYPTNRRRRRRNNRDLNDKDYKVEPKVRNKENDSYHYTKSSSNRRESYSSYDDKAFNERLSSLHQPKFKASEVPSAIFGMRQQKEVPNSGLKGQSPYENTQDKNGNNDNQELDNNRNNPKKTSREVVQDVPTYSKTDNTINIENIYASQIVSEIRKEREKKLQKKKQFEKALREKREQELKNIDSEKEKSKLKTQDYFLKQQASYIKHNSDSIETEDDDYENNAQESLQSHNLNFEDQESAIEEQTEAFQPDAQDPTTYEFKEINLDFEDYENEEEVEEHDLTNEFKSVDNEQEEVLNHENALLFEEIEDIEPVEEVNDFNKPTSESNIEEDNPVEDVNLNHYLEDDMSFEEDDEEVEDLSSNQPHFEEVIEPDEEDITHIQDENDVEEVESNQETLQEVADSEVRIDEHETPIEHASKEPVLRPDRKKVSPFNVLMTPSDKRKYKNIHQKTETIDKTSHDLNETREDEQSTESNETAKKRKGPLYVLPPISILDDVVETEDNTEWLEAKKKELDEAFYHFNVPAHVVNMIQGPTVTRFELSVEKGVKVSRITALQDDIKMALAAKDIRIEAPIPGTSLVGIEVPNQSPKKIPLGQMITSKHFQQAESKLTVAMGFKINNEPLLMDIAKTPHALIAGATGSGKSVCINAILTSLLYKNHPDELKLLLIDPKMVELAPYNNLPHLVAPVITDVKAATASLKWAVEEMERRYKRFAELHVRNITAFNKKANYEQRMAKIVIVIDELADLMMMSPQEVEQSIARIAQKARACGIHMILATQRPSVNVITGLIKANVPTRISFMVSSSIDSRTILDVGGAEKLLGNGDMLYLGNGMNKPIRVQGAFVSDDEIDETVSNVSKQMKPNYLFKEETLLKKVNEQPADALFDDVCEFMVKEGHISTSLIQRHFQIGYNRAARMIDNLEERGFISGPNGSKPRDVLITQSTLEEKDSDN